MYGFMKSKGVPAFLVCAMLLALALPAKAGFIMRIQQGATIIDVRDNDALDQDPLVGAISFGGTVGNYVINEITGTSKPRVGDPDNAALQITSLETRNSVSGQSTLVISLSDTDFTFPSGPNLDLGSAIGVTFRRTQQGDTISFQSYADASNAEFGQGTTTGLQSFTSPGGVLPTGFSNTTSTQFTRGPGPYSLTNVTTLTLSAEGEGNTSGTTAVVLPAPGALVLVLTGVPFLGAAGWLRRRKLA